MTPMPGIDINYFLRLCVGSLIRWTHLDSIANSNTAMPLPSHRFKQFLLKDKEVFLKKKLSYSLVRQNF